MRWLNAVLAVSAIAAAALGAGCSSGPPPQSAVAPPHVSAPVPPSPSPPASAAVPALVRGAADSVGALPGTPGALFRYRFKQIDPGSERFTFQDRELSFYFRPTPAALFFQVENRQDRPVWIDWERSSFSDPLGNGDKIAHAPTRWADRFRTQNSTQIPGLQRYTDYMFPLAYLVDPADSDDQLHRPLFPEDNSAQQYSDREFGVSLVFEIENVPRTYTFRFRVASVIPR